MTKYNATQNSPTTVLFYMAHSCSINEEVYAMKWNKKSKQNSQQLWVNILCYLKSNFFLSCLKPVYYEAFLGKNLDTNKDNR